MKYTFTREQVKRIIIEELKSSKIDDAAEDILDDFENTLSEAEGDSAIKKLYNKIFKKSQEENIDADQLAVRTWKKSQNRLMAKKVLAGMTLAAFLGGLQAYKDVQDLQGLKSKQNYLK